MELENETGLTAQVLRVQLFYKDLLMSTVICKATYEVGADGTVALAAKQAPITVEDEQTPLGIMSTDIVPIKQGCDLCVYGHAVSAISDASVRSVRVNLRIGAYTRGLLVSGDRRWRKAMKQVVATQAEPFARLPLTYAHAYGGKTEGELGFERVWTDNPDGKGFLGDKEEPDGKPLPNVEELDQLINDARDRPLAAGFAAMPRSYELRGARGIRVDVEEQTTHLTPLSFNHAHPRMLLESYPAGAAVELAGMTHGEPWSFALPRMDLGVHVDLGGRQHWLRLTPDTLTLLPEQRAFHVVARRALIYQFVPERLRSMTVSWASADRPEERRPTIAELRGGASLPELPILPMSEYPMSFEELLRLYPLTPVIESLPICASA